MSIDVLSYNMSLPKVVLVLFFVFFSNSSGCKDRQRAQDIVRVRIANKSENSFTRVSMFSMDFGGLEPGGISEYKTLDFDPLRDDSLMYCTLDDYTYSTYVQMPGKGAGNYTYSIDSIRNDLVYISIRLD